MATDDTDTPSEQLSLREKEIVACVAKGMTSKEIADRLCLSVHTVTTHRRNITSKLQIHTPAGLTIYAIANHIVSLDEIKLQ
jgi:regulator of cell morphogenesis and NO signaling